MPSRARVAAALAATALAIAGGAYSAGCYTNNQGNPPKVDGFYYPTGIAVSAGQTTLYVANSDFDLQFNGGTVFSLDLAGAAPARFGIRDELGSLLRALLAHDPTAVGGPAGTGGAGGSGAGGSGGGSAGAAPVAAEDDAGIATACAAASPIPLQQNPDQLIHPGPCSPIPLSSPQTNHDFLQGKAIVGAFASGLALAYPPAPKKGEGARLLVPVRGDPSVTYFGIADDRNGSTTLPDKLCTSTIPAACLSCGQDPNGDEVTARCDDAHRVGTTPNDQRLLVLPEEPVGIAVSAPVTLSGAPVTGGAGGGATSGQATQIRSAVVVAHQTRNAASLLQAPWLSASDTATVPPPPTLEFPLSSLENGPTELAAIPIPALVGALPPFSYSPGFVLTYRTSAVLDLLRAHFDDGASPPRPYLVRVASTPVNTSASGADQRGVAIDATERKACEDACGASNVACLTGCLDVPLHIYVASRAPAALITGLIHTTTETTDGAVTGIVDSIELTGQVPLTQGPSRVGVGRIIGPDGKPQTRIFAVAFDTRAVFGYDPVLDRVDMTIRTGRGPQAVAFDIGKDSAGNDYAYMYVAHFTDSYVGVVDLDARHFATFGTMFATLGTPVPPRESQ